MGSLLGCSQPGRPGEVPTWGFTCAVTADDGSILCWGDNRHGPLGNDSTERALTPTPIASRDATLADALQAHL
jgi:hypothetical protein